MKCFIASSPIEIRNSLPSGVGVTGTRMTLPFVAKSISANEWEDIDGLLTFGAVIELLMSEMLMAGGRNEIESIL